MTSWNLASPAIIFLNLAVRFSPAFSSLMFTALGTQFTWNNTKNASPQEQFERRWLNVSEKSQFFSWEQSVNFMAKDFQARHSDTDWRKLIQNWASGSV